jgi:hypothetical protein
MLARVQFIFASMRTNYFNKVQRCGFESQNTNTKIS